VDGETGLLVPFKTDGKGPCEPRNPQEFERDLARKVNLLMKDPALRLKMGHAGRKRAEDHFGWPAIAKRTFELYQSLVRP